ncbi:MAG: hypothetical protein ACOX6P_02375 [Candidatus Merdivicinus sp.]|jgi:predicted ribosomally synthesized peptide with SipW-like signal peptide
MTKKKIAIALAAAALVGTCAIGGSLAWLTANTNEVKNTFTVGNVTLDISETGGTYNSSTDKYDFTIVPGVAFDKAPKITVNANSVDCYLFSSITIVNDGDDVVLPENWTLEGKNGSWEYVAKTTSGESTTYVYRQETVVSKSTNDQEFSLFVKAKLNADYDQADYVDDPFAGEIIVKGYAVQAEGFTDWTGAYDAIQVEAGLPTRS